MTTNLVKEQVCLYLRNGIEIWVDKDKAKDFSKDLIDGLKAFVYIEKRLVNTVDIVGIFQPDDLEDLKRRKNGQWKCDKGAWHDRGEYCGCGIQSTSFVNPKTDNPVKEETLTSVRNTLENKGILKQKGE
jgi:hypothetical protein